MDRVSVFVRRRRIKNLEQWTLYAILTEAFFLAFSETVAAAAIMIGVITYFLRLQIDSRYKMRGLPFDVPVTIFLLIGAISVLFSSARSFDLIYNYCMLVGIYALTYLIVGQSVRTTAQVKLIAQALGAAAILVVLWGFFQFIFGIDAADIKWTDPDAFPELKKRVFSTLENPNVLAGYLDVFICLALGFLAKAQERSHRLILLGAIILFVACLAMTYSRGAFLTLVAVFAVYGFIKDWRIVILFALVIGIIFYSDSTFMNRILSAFTMSDSSEGVRVGIWVSTSAMIADHPFTGIGWGAYQFVYPQYNYYIADPNIIIYHAHNLYLNVAAEIGIVGALAFFWYFFGTMFISFGISEHGAEKWFSERLDKILASSTFLQEISKIINETLANFSKRVVNLFSVKKRQHKLKKTRSSLVHNDEMNFSEHTRKKFTKVEKIPVGDGEIAIKREQTEIPDDKEEPDKKSAETLNDALNINDRNFLDGFKLGIGLAFLSMALNGFTDHLLFNIPSAMLMWLLGALSAAIKSNEELGMRN